MLTVMAHRIGTMKEKDGIRGLVAARHRGAHDRAYVAYLKELNPRNNKQVRESLAASPDPRFQEFLDRVSRPRYFAVSLATIAKACGIDLLEFSRWWSSECSQRSIVLAQTESVNITKDMILDALSTETVCSRCDGMTWVAAPAGLPLTTPGYTLMQAEGGEIRWTRTCPVCQGKGRNRKPGDAHSRDRVLEMASLLQRGKGVQVNLNVGGGASHASAVGDLSKMTIDVGEVMDVESEGE